MSGLKNQGVGGTTDEGTIVRDRPKTKPKDKIKKPSMYVVVVHNDPFTPRSFVVEVLQRYFSKNSDEATRIMMMAHNYGVGAVASYTFEIAETKAQAANEYSRDEGHPLQFSIQDA